MSWEDRLAKALYTAPSGDSISFNYRELVSSVTRKTSGHEFPDAEGTYVQDLGTSSRRFVLKVHFNGEDVDIDASTFERLVSERGVGVLNHPRQGVVSVIPFGSITRRDDLVRAANEIIFEITFWETLLDVYPTTQLNAASQLQVEVLAFNDAAAAAYAEDISLESAVETETFKSKIDSQIREIKANFAEVSSTLAEAQDAVDDVFSTIDASLDVLVDAPLDLAYSVLNLIQTPARALGAIEARLSASLGLVTQLFATPIKTPGFGNIGFNDVKTDDLTATGALAGAALSVANGQFSTQGKALEAADSILVAFNDYASWREDTLENYEVLDTRDDFAQLQRVVTIAAGLLIEISFTLDQEKAVVLAKPRNIVELVGSLYKDLDKLDYFIQTNNLTGSEILEVPAGRRIVYYG